MTDAIDLLFTEVRSVAALGAVAAVGSLLAWFVAPIIGIFAFSIGFFALGGVSIARCARHQEPVRTISPLAARG